MAPTPEEMRIAAGALESEADTWRGFAPQLDSIESTLAGIGMSRTEAGLFQIMFDSYEACRAVVEDRAREGAAEFRTMADTLRDLSVAYRDADAERAAEIANVW